MTDPARGNLADLVTVAAQQYGNRPALIGDGPDRSWAELDAAAHFGAAALMDAGLTPTDRVLVMLPTSADLAVARIAMARAGLVAVPIEPGQADVGDVVSRVGATAAIATTPVAGVSTSLSSADVGQWWGRSGSQVDAVSGGEDLAELDRAMRSSRPVMIPHRAVLAAVAAIVASPGLGLRADDRAVLALPLSHLSGFVTAFLPLAVVGGAAVLPAPGATIGDVIRDHRVTVLPGSPAVYRQLLADPAAERALATVRLMTSGAAPLAREDFVAIKSLTGQNVWEGYGISEATSAVATSLMTRQSRSGSVGLPLAGLRVQIVPDGTDDLDAWFAAAEAEATTDEPDDTAVGSAAALDEPTSNSSLAPKPARGQAADVDTEGDELPMAESAEPSAAASGARPETLADIDSVGEVGRIAIHGGTLFLGYWPDGSGGPRPDGWFVTTDIGYADDRGELHLVDRAEDTFQVAGFTVYPREIERILADHPYVAEAVVVGLPSARGSTVVAVLTPAPGKRPTAADMAEFVGERLPIFKRPTEFVVVAQMPRTELGRLDRPAVLAQVAADHQIDLAAPPPPLAAVRPEPDDAQPPVEAATSAADDPAEDIMPRDVSPETAGDLDQLGRDLPGKAARVNLVESDDDLFGDDYL